MNSRNFTLLIIFQIIISFLLGVFGNKFSELFSIKPIYIIIILVILLILSVILSIPTSNFKINGFKIWNFIDQNKILIIPIFFIIGLTVSFLLLKAFEQLNGDYGIALLTYLGKANDTEFFIGLYEIITYTILAILVWYSRKLNFNPKLLLISLIGATTGITSSLSYFNPEENDAITTFFGGLLTCIIILSLIEFLHKYRIVKKSSS